MITKVDERLRREAKQYALRFGCEACVAFDADARTCAHAYPNAQHVGIDLGTCDEVVFCKQFEVG